jgi:hypothetical protein
MKQFPSHYPNINGRSVERAFEFSYQNQLIANIQYSIPKKIASKKDDEGQVDKDWVDKCEFPLYKMPSTVKFEDKYTGIRSGAVDALEIKVLSEIVSVESLGKVTCVAHLLNAAKMYLMRSYGFLVTYLYLSQPVTILADTSITRSLNAIKYAVKHRDFGKDDIGYLFYLGSDHMLHLHFSFSESNYESYKSYRDYVVELTEHIIQSLKITHNVPALKTADAIVEKEEILTWKEFSIPCRYELERSLLLQGIVSAQDCYYTFDETSLKADWVMLGDDDKKNFLSKDTLVPSLDFKNFNGKIQVPASQNPDNPVEKEIARLIDEKSKLLQVFLKSLAIPVENHSG